MKNKKLRAMTATAIFAAISSVLMFVNFAVPFAPSYLKIDFSDLPALLASFSLGPVYGLIVSAIKNLINLPFSNTGFVGELSNFLLSALFVLPAGLIYQRAKSKKTAVLGMIIGLVTTTVLSYFTNTYLVYPAYSKIMPVDTIINMSKQILPAVDSVSDVILIFNMPFTFVKGLLNAIVTFVLYKRLSPIIMPKQ